MMRKSAIFQSALAILFIASVAHGQSLPPAKPDGFVYGNKRSVDIDAIQIEAFFDPVCPDSRDSWPALKQALSFYGDRVYLVLHLLPLPYHDNAYAVSRALHIVNNMNSSATFPLMEYFFKYQKKFYNAQTRELSRADVERKIITFASDSVGNAYHTTLQSGFADRKTDLKTRVSFKYSTSRGVYGTPFFYVNGFKLGDTDSALDFNAWKSVIDPLVGKKRAGKIEDTLHYFL